MEPTFYPGDVVVTNKLAYGLKVPTGTGWITEWGQPKRGDKIVFLVEHNVRYVKRLIGLPGDRISIHQGHLCINGVQCEYFQSSVSPFPIEALDDKSNPHL